jgi:hypothetical protein
MFKYFRGTLVVIGESMFNKNIIFTKTEFISEGYALKQKLEIPIPAPTQRYTYILTVLDSFEIKKTVIINLRSHIEHQTVSLRKLLI